MTTILIGVAVVFGIILIILIVFVLISFARQEDGPEEEYEAYLREFLSSTREPPEQQS